MIVYPPITPTAASPKLNMSSNVSASSAPSASSTATSTNKSNNSYCVSSSSSSNNNNSSGSSKRQTQVQWRLTNVQQGVVKVDSAQLYSLLKTEPIEKYYELDEEPFAQGAFASVRRVRSLETGQVYAAKFSSRTRYGEDSTAEIYHEIALLSLCSPSPRIVKLHDVFQTSEEIIIVMEFAPGGDMQTIIDDNVVPFEGDVVRFVQQVVEGLAYLHHRKIAHLDIKPQNLVMMGDFPDCNVKVCDFEISRVILDGTQIRELLGTPEYVAPEILHYEPITLAADMWSLGVTVYVLLTGFSPFGGETDQETFLNISQARLDFPEELFEDVSENAIDFVKRLLVRNPRERMTAKECLKHPWLANNKKKLISKKSVAPKSEATRGRVGCSSCSVTNHNHQNLRKYLSKSREALFERVITKHKQHSMAQQTGQNLRKSTLLSQYDKTKRMCESQMSLVSKSRERLLQGSMSPSITRSREKLYGIKCLSKSHEVLNLCKTVSALASSSDNKKPLEGLLKTLTRAATADLTSNNNNNNNGSNEIIEDVSEENNVKHIEDNQTKVPDNSSQTVNNTIVTQNNNKEIKQTTEKKETVVASLPVSLIPDYQPLQTVLTLLRSNKTNTNNMTTNSIIVNDDNKENIMNSKEDESEENLRKKVLADNKKESSNISSSDIEENKLTIERPKLCLMKQLSVISSEGDDLNSPAISHSDSLSLTEGNSTSESDLSEEDHNGSLEHITCDVSSGDDDEPRFTVKQLISAYNMHQEIVTKTSLEVTMNTPNAEQKILPVIDKVPNKKFPTGPNALRIFIPDLHIKSKRTSRRKHLMRKEGENYKEQLFEENQGNSTETEKNKTEDIKHCGKDNQLTEKTNVPDENKNATYEFSNSKKNSLIVDNFATIYNRSSSLSSETSCDKTSGLSSTMTSCEDIIITSGDNLQKKSQSNRSSDVISIDSDNIAEEQVNENFKKVSLSNRSSGVISSDGENITEGSVFSSEIPKKTSRSNRSSIVLSSDVENISESVIISSGNSRKTPKSNRSSGITSSDSENIIENITSSSDIQPRQRKISRSNRSSGVLSSDGENVAESSSNEIQQQRQRKISRSNRSSGIISSDGENASENFSNDNVQRHKKISRNNRFSGPVSNEVDNTSVDVKSSNDNPKKITNANRSSSDVTIAGVESNSTDVSRKLKSNRSSHAESTNSENLTSDATMSSDNYKRISRSNRLSGVESSDGENVTDEFILSSDIPRKPRSNRSSRIESFDCERLSSEIISSSDSQLPKKSKSNRSSAVSTVHDSDNITDILNKTTTTSSSIKNSEKTLSTGTPRLNRKSFPCSRSTSVASTTTEKTRRKSNPVMKPPFY